MQDAKTFATFVCSNTKIAFISLNARLSAMKLLVTFPLLEKLHSKRNRVLNAAILAKISVKFERSL